MKIPKPSCREFDPPGMVMAIGFYGLKKGLDRLIENRFVPINLESKMVVPCSKDMHNRLRSAVKKEKLWESSSL